MPLERVDRHLTPGVQRVLDRHADLPVVVLDASWSIVACNPLGAALVGDPTALRGNERNLIWRHFSGAASCFVRDENEAERFEREAVADLHAALGRYRDDPDLRALIAGLRELSPRFEELWRARPVAARSASRKTINHPEAGLITVDCDVLTAQDSDLRLVVYSAAPGSADADALALVRVLGLQELTST